MNLNWKKGMFSSTYQLFAGEQEVGYHVEDELMMLTGLFIFNHFPQIMMTVFMISMIIIAAGN